MWRAQRTQPMHQVAVTLLSEGEYHAIQRSAAHDVPVTIGGWALFLSVVLERAVTTVEAQGLITAYNARCRKEWGA